MTIVAAKPLVPFWHKPKDAEEQENVRFRLRGLTTLELMEVTTNAVSSEDENGEQNLKYGTASLRAAIGSGLVGWEGFNDADGNVVPYQKNATQKVNLLGPILAPEIFWEILFASNLNLEQRKN